MGGLELVQGLLQASGGAFTLTQGLAFFALILSIGILATSRPLLTLVVLFGGPTLVMTATPGLSNLAWLVLIGGLVWGEHHLRSTEWAELFQGAFELQGVLGIVVAWTALVFGTKGDGAAFDLGAAPTALALVAGLFVAVLLHAVVYRARARVWRLIRDVSMATVTNLVETAMVGTLALVLLYAPFLALAVAAAAVVPLLVAAGVIQAGTRMVDARRRAPCPSCGRSVRIEASRCPYCKSTIPVVHALR
ncbi:MAG: hypothetical protein AAF602_04000 [Myxococcota bacterium]